MFNSITLYLHGTKILIMTRDSYATLFNRRNIFILLAVELDPGSFGMKEGELYSATLVSGRSSRNLSIFQADHSVRHSCKILIVSYNDKGLTEFVSQYKEHFMKLLLVLGIQVS